MRDLEGPPLEALRSDGTLHVVVADAADRCRCAKTTCHVWRGRFAPGSFVKLESEVFVSSPEMSFAQMAAELPLIQLVAYGYDLCGTYVRNQDSAEGFHKRTKPLTSVNRLSRFVDKLDGRNGAKKARRALRFIADNAASPMEAIVTMSLCLPRMIGGYGLELPELNTRIDVKEKSLVNRDHFECDLYWREHRAAVEYDSREHHAGAEAESHDSSRRSALLAQRVTVVSVTPEQFFDARRFDETARAVAKLTGKRLPPNDASWMMKRYRMRTELLKDLTPRA